MLRNLNETLPGGGRILGTPFVGTLGSVILANTAVGDFGAGIFGNDDIDPVARYRALVTSRTFPAGTFRLNEDGSGQFTATGAATLTLFEGNVSYGTSTLAGEIGVTAPAILTQPASQSWSVGQTATFSVTATGTAPLSYQWRRNGSPISGATSASYSFTTALADSGAVFSVVVSNAAGTVTSANATLTVTGIPASITTQPQAQSVVEGQAATFSVVASGTAPLSYQWRRNGVPISGANAASYTTPVASVTGGSANNGDLFSVVVSNAAGSATSSNASLTVTALQVPPTISAQPQAQTVADGATATFAVTATGTSPLAFQWFRNGAPISGATAASYSLPGTLADSGAAFSVVVSNAAGNATSAPAALTVTPVAPTIIAQPQPQSAIEGQSVTFTAAAIGSTPLAYQWRRNGAAISGATLPTLSFIAGLADSGAVYSAVVSNAGGQVISQGATLTVTAAAVPPSISTQPQTQSVVDGSVATFSVVASGTAPISYQWRRNGTAIPGETAATLSLLATLADDGALITVLVTNAAGSVSSAAATLTVTANEVAPTVTQQPTPQTVTPGTPITLTAAAVGTAPLAFQWRRNGVPIAGATGTSYSFTATQADGVATFDAVISNAVGQTTTAPVRITVVVPDAQTDYERWLPRVLPDVPGCPDVTVIHHARLACREWFERTLSWREQLAPITAAAGDSSYLLPLPPDSVLAKLMTYVIDGRDGVAVSVQTGLKYVRENRSGNYCWTQDNRNVSVHPAPTAAQVLEFGVALKPSDDSSSIPERLFDLYADKITDGILARIFGMASQPWTSADRESAYRAKFVNSIESAAIAAAKSYSATSGRSKPLLY